MLHRAPLETSSLLAPNASITQKSRTAESEIFSGLWFGLPHKVQNEFYELPDGIIFTVVARR